MFLETVKDG